MKNPSQINQNGAQERPKGLSGCRSPSERFLGVPAYAFLACFWRILVDFGRHLGPSWAPRGSQNRPFWRQDAPEVEKMTHKKGSQKKLEIWIEI